MNCNRQTAPGKISKPKPKQNSPKLTNRNTSQQITIISFEKPNSNKTASSMNSNRQTDNSNSNITTSLFNWKKKETKYGTFFSASPAQSHKRARAISNEEMIRVLHLSQVQAAKILDCHLSTLKRRFNKTKHTLGLESWPQNFQTIRHLPIFKQMYPMSLSFILNKDSN